MRRRMVVQSNPREERGLRGIPTLYGPVMVKRRPPGYPRQLGGWLSGEVAKPPGYNTINMLTRRKRIKKRRLRKRRS